eukprot:COSAG01_NODE_50257_length_364_cov_7.298113_1_plen_67_part_10
MARIARPIAPRCSVNTGAGRALEQETHDDMHKAKTKQALRLAQLAKQAQDTAREAAQAKYEEGKELL